VNYRPKTKHQLEA